MKEGNGGGGKKKIGSFPILNLLLEEENAEFPDEKYINVENLEELTHHILLSLLSTNTQFCKCYLYFNNSKVLNS